MTRDVLVDSLIATILRRDAPDEVKQNSLDLLRKLADDGSRYAKRLVHRLKFDADRQRWTLQSIPH